MPLYEFDVLNGETGSVIETIAVRVPMAERNSVLIRRRTVPSSVSISGVAEVPTQGHAVIKGYRKEELKKGSRFKSEFTPDQIKKAWAKPAPVG